MAHKRALLLATDAVQIVVTGGVCAVEAKLGETLTADATRELADMFSAAAKEMGRPGPEESSAFRNIEYQRLLGAMRGTGLGGWQIFGQMHNLFGRIG